MNTSHYISDSIFSQCLVLIVIPFLKLFIKYAFKLQLNWLKGEISVPFYKWLKRGDYFPFIFHLPENQRKVLNSNERHQDH
jgi:hypothetical protein